MSDKDKNEATEAAYKPFSWWQKYAGKPVLIQLREGLSWIGVTSPNDPVMNGEGQIVSIPFLKGTLGVEGEAQDFRLVVDTLDPNPNNPHVKMKIMLHPDDAAFVTVVEAGLVTG